MFKKLKKSFCEHQVSHAWKFGLFRVLLILSEYFWVIILNETEKLWSFLYEEHSVILCVSIEYIYLFMLPIVWFLS